MATNKKKEAAALFELIDKSTLKIPKNAGALKIPSWWSSKTNPPVNGAAATIAAPRVTAKPINGESSNGSAREVRQAPTAGDSALPETPTETADAAISEPAAAPAPTPDPAPPRQIPVQNRLFQPPPQDAVEPASPSIRPPARTPIVPAPAAVATSPAAPPHPLAMEPLSEEEGPGADAPDAPKPPARPMTAAPATAPGLSAQRRRSANFTSVFGNIPRPVLIAAATGGGILLLLILFFALRGPKHATPAIPGGDESTPTQITGPGGGHAGQADPNNSALHVTPGNNTPAPGGGHGILDPGPDANRTPPAPAGNPGPHPGPAAPGGATAGKIYEPHIFPFQPSLVYWVMESDSSESIARRNAKVLADHGVDVAIEKTKTGYWALVITQGFASNSAAEPFRKKINELAKFHPDYKLTHHIWTDAAPNHITFGATSN